MAISPILREPTAADLKVGRGEPSGKGGQWRILDVLTDTPLTAHYQDSSYEVRSLGEWKGLPSVGVQILSCDDGRYIAKNADEYRYNGLFPKFGLYIDDDEYDKLIESVCRG